MLKYFLENDLVRFCDNTPDNWEDAVAVSCQNLLEKKIVTQSYIDEVINCVKKYGPYIVIVPGVAMPHSSEGSAGVLGTAISFTKMNKVVSFEEGNPEKDAQLFFTLAAKNAEEHMENIANLSDMLMKDGLIEALITADTLEDYKIVMKEFKL